MSPEKLARAVRLAHQDPLGNPDQQENREPEVSENQGRRDLQDLLGHQEMQGYLEQKDPTERQDLLDLKEPQGKVDLRDRMEDQESPVFPDCPDGMRSTVLALLVLSRS